MENLGLERDVNWAVSIFYGFPLSTCLYIFPTIGRRMTGNANGLKVQKFKLVISLNLQNLDETDVL